MGNEPAAEPHRMRRGKDKVNPIQQSFRSLKIRLVYPPSTFTGNSGKPSDITDRTAANMRYLLKAGGKEYRNKTNGDGIMLELVPSDVESANLTLYVKETQDVFWQLDLVIGDLDECETRIGAKARLNNLGLFASETLDLSADFNQVYQDTGSDQYNQYLRAIERFDRLFGGTPPNTMFTEKGALDRIKVVHGG